MAELRTEYEIKEALINAIEEKITDARVMKLLNTDALLPKTESRRKGKDLVILAVTINEYLEKEARNAKNKKEINGVVVEAMIKHVSIQKRVTGNSYNKNFISDEVLGKAWRYVENNKDEIDQTGKPTWDKLTLFLNAFGYNFNSFEHLKQSFTKDYSSLNDLLEKAKKGSERKDNEDNEVAKNTNNPTDTKIIEASEGNINIPISPLPVPEKRDWNRRILLISLLVSFVVVGAYLYLHFSTVKRDFFLSKENYNILILPFLNPETQSDQVSKVGEELEKGLNQKNRLNKLGVEAKYLSSDINDIVPENAKKLGRKLQADMVIWGTDSKPENELHQIFFHYAFLIADTVFEGRTEKFETDRLVNITEGTMSLEIEDVIYWCLGNKFMFKEDYRSALNNFKKIKSSEYHDEELYFYLANCYSKLDSFGTAKIYYEKVLSMNPTDTVAALAYNNYAFLLLDKLNDSINAKINFEKAIAIHYDKAIACLNYACLLDKKFNDTANANIYYQEALKIDPHFGAAHYHYAVLLQNKFHKFKEAQVHFEKALRVCNELCQGKAINSPFKHSYHGNTKQHQS